MYVAYTTTDDLAHAGRYDEYLSMAHRIDGYIKELWDFVLREDAYRNNTTFIITIDHGRGSSPLENWQHHGNKSKAEGGKIEGSDEIWIAVIGPDTPALGEIQYGEQLYQSQVASTIATLLEITPGKKMDPPMAVIFK